MHLYLYLYPSYRAVSHRSEFALHTVVNVRRSPVTVDGVGGGGRITEIEQES